MMGNRQTRWILAGSLLTALAGCEITKVDCDETPDADICQDDDFDAGDFPDDGDDAGASSDAAMDGGKADASADGGKSDASSSDAGTDGSSSSDGASSDASNGPLTVDEFCVAQLATAVAWRDALEGLCGSTTALDARQTFLELVFSYSRDDAEGKCITALNGLIDSGNATFDGSKAQACADAYLKSQTIPPSPFPTNGVDLAMYESKIGHGAPATVQIPECRATFKGKLARDKTCTGNHFACADGLRCLDAPGGTKTCQPALTIGTCTASAQCADGYICVGSPNAAGGKTCVKTDSLPGLGGNCEISRECETGLVCNSSNKCGPPAAEVICKP